MEIGTSFETLNWKVRLFAGSIGCVFFVATLLLIDWIFSDDFQSINSYIFQGVFFGFFMGLSLVYGGKKLSNWLRLSKKEFALPNLEPNEEIEISGPANLFRGVEGVGGKLYFTNQKLIFNSHKINLQSGQTNIDYSEIVSVEKRKTGFIVNNGIRVIIRAGKSYDFVVNNREEWLFEFEKRVLNASLSKT